MRAIPESVKILYYANTSDEPYVEIVTVTHQKSRQRSVCSLLDSLDSQDLLPVLLDLSHVLKEHHLDKLFAHMPVRTQEYHWKLMYSTAEHGTSLKTLYRNMTDVDRPVLLVVKDMDNQVFGAFSSDPFKVSTCCYGTGETFLYSFSPDFQVFRWSGKNSYFIRGFFDSLQMGAGGGHFGLWLDADLHRGSSYSCNTFCNRPLSIHQDFIIQDVEVWTFV
ncbi:nuclear receptor coactivator 7 [Triplophysa dalaica]|uniref:nuclear receptor coactivator 7 n=1 Tax=Triplophysa dalaica TaxID=1582913 RepID=UPI0024DFCD67|nr:nuclear receptor coactivator 7 [Triplophysa dalaica]